MRIRHATAEDAAAACEVLRRSITELCGSDHMDDPAVLGAWLANKTQRNVAAWIADPGRCTLVAAGTDGAILGVGMANATGEIALNYVSPDARFRGISRALVGALEDWLRGLGRSRCRLVSTETACRFYTGLGYRPDGPAQPAFGVAASQPMAREL